MEESAVQVRAGEIGEGCRYRVKIEAKVVRLLRIAG
jgi:hypothetical protein